MVLEGAWTCTSCCRDNIFPRFRDHGGLRRDGSEFFRWLRSQRPVQCFGESVEDVACRAFHGHALVSQTIQEHAALRSIKRKKVRAAEQIRALRVFFLERFRILSEKA